MRTIKPIPVVLSKWISPVYRVMLGIIALLIAIVLFASPPPPINMKVMKKGLGSGTVTSSGINCGGDCDEPVTSGVPVTLTATPADAESVFSHWEGAASGPSTTVTVTMTSDFFVKAVFDVATPIPELTDFTPGGIQTYLAANPTVNSPARFVAALPAQYKWNWILMSRSESLQTGTAESPRLLLPSLDARAVFTIGMQTHGSYPGSHPNAIEYMQWDPAEKNFRFHEIVLNSIPAMGTVPARTRMVSVDDSKCSKCHSTNNVLNRSSFPGTTGIPPGIVKYKNKPNWDTYDSWGGLMPLNRDRIYQGSVEAAAFRKIFNLWTWSTNDPVRSIIEQLELQPPVAGIPVAHTITRAIGGANDGHITFAFDASPPVFTEPAPTGSGAPISTNYTFNNLTSGAATSVVRDGTFITLHHSNIAGSDEGRAVRFFDALGGLAGNLNQTRVADELVSHRFATGSVPIDIRPIALAISRGLVELNAARTAIISTPALTVDLSFFDSRNGTTINNLYNDTRTRSESAPRRKADIQKINLDRSSDNYLFTGAPAAPANGLIQQYGASTSAGTSTAMSRIRQEVFRRPLDFFPADATVMGGIYVDREDYDRNTEMITLFRYFLEPLGVSVDKWSMGVRGRSRTYTFADVFYSYLNPVFIPTLRASLLSNPVPGLTDPDNDAQLIAAVNSTLSPLPAATAVPTYTDVQRIFNKSCIECHGGLNYPPYSNYGTFLDLSEDEAPPGTDKRLDRSNGKALAFTSGDPATSYLYQRITRPNEDCPSGLMPCGGPALSKTDIETIRRWIVGGRPYSNGDPHLGTIDGVNYDFHATGEFVLLRGENLEMQARHRAIETNSPLGPNGHTGLTTCVSVNSAVALRVGRHRITYQPNLSGQPDPSGLQLRVDGNLVQLSAQGISLAADGRIMQTSAPGGIQIEASGGTVIVITPGWWDSYQLWYLHIDTRHVRATEGLMGAIAPGNWLPALPNGTLMGPRPANLNQRYNDLYGTFGNAWRVNDTTSLFDYARGTSTRTFITPGWPGGESPQNCKVPADSGRIKPLKPMTLEVAQRLAAGIVDADRRANLIQDLMVTGDSGFAKTYLLADKINRNKLPDAPVLVFPKDFDTLDVLPVKFSWNNSTDKDGDPLTYKLYVWPVNEIPDLNKSLTTTSTKTGWWSGGLKCALIVGLIGLLLFIILYFMGLRKKPGLLALLALAILAAAIIAYFLCGKTAGSNFKEVSSGLQPGKAYFWKVITEDGKGGTVESETRRLQIK